MRNNIKIAVTLAALILLQISALAQKKYADIYYSMSDMTLDQLYSELMDYQRTDPYFANTYIQLGLVSENKMVLGDPLRDFDEVQFWANNAALFFGNFKGFYKDGDVRTNEEFYGNLNIQAQGKRLTDTEIRDFVERHRAFCQNFKDTTALAFHALEESKGHYNQCIATCKAICDKYPTLSEMLLQHNDELSATLEGLSQDIDKCVAAFAEYKKITKTFPILNYRQLYDLKTIETFRLDGLTNSDFLENRFTMWDYRQWIDNFNKTLEADIVPLRNKIAEIDAKFRAGKQEYEAGGALNVAAEAAYDDLFVFQLGRYDNNSLVRELFSYLEERRQLYVMARDTLALPIENTAAMANRKMRHIYRMASSLAEADNQLVTFSEAIDAEKVRRFVDFFQKNYGGEAGLKNFAQTEASELSKTFKQTLTNYGIYLSEVDKAREENRLMSNKTKSAAAVPLYVGETENQYVTQHILYDAQGRPTYVAGIKGGKNGFVARIDEDGNTAWIVDLKADVVTQLSASPVGCAVAVRLNDLPSAVVLDDAGKELIHTDISEGQPAFVNYNDMTQTIYAAFDEANTSTLCKIDSVGAKTWTVELPMESVSAMEEMPGGLVITGLGGGKVKVAIVTTDGVVQKTLDFGSDIKRIVNIYRASAREVCIFSQNSSGQTHYTSVFDNGQIIYSTLK